MRGTKKAAPRSVPWDGCNITAVPPKLHTAFCRMPLDAPITWGRPGGDYSCFPASAQKRQHTAPPYRVFSSPRLSGWRKRHTLFFLAFNKKNIAFFVRFVNLFFIGTKFSQLPFSVRAALRPPFFCRMGRTRPSRSAIQLFLLFRTAVTRPLSRSNSGVFRWSAAMTAPNSSVYSTPSSRNQPMFFAGQKLTHP